MSVINKMLNDLDDRQNSEQAKDDVAFMTPVAKPKRKWLVTLVSSIVLGLGAIWGTYYFYGDILELAGVQVPKQPTILTPEQIQARIEAADAAEKARQEAQEQQPQQGQTAAAQAQEPELIILKPNNNGEAPAERPSTLSVVAMADSAQPAQPPQAQQSTGQDNQQRSDPLAAQAQTAQGEAGTQDDGQVEPDNSPSQAMVTPSNEPKNAGAPTASKEKMQISKVRLSPGKRAEKAYLQAKELSKGGMIVESMDKYREVLRFKPDHQQGRSELAALYYGRNMTLEALELLDQGLELDPGNIGWSLLAAKIHYKRTNFAAAFAYLQLPVETYDNVEYVALRATSAYKLKEYESARQAYQQLTVADPGNGRWWLGLGTTYEALGQQVYAVKAYRKSLRLSNISSSSRQFVMSRLQRLAN